MPPDAGPAVWVTVTGPSTASVAVGAVQVWVVVLIPESDSFVVLIGTLAKTGGTVSLDGVVPTPWMLNTKVPSSGSSLLIVTVAVRVPVAVGLKVMPKFAVPGFGTVVGAGLVEMLKSPE